MKVLASVSVDDPLSLGQIAREYHLAEAHLRKLATSGRLRALKVGRDWAATRSAVEDYLDSRKYNAKNVPTERNG